MANAILTMKVMPETADINLEQLEKEVTEIITGLGGRVGKVEKKPIAFGLNSLEFMFVADENKGTEEFERKVGELEDVQSAQVIDFRRAIG